MIKTVIFDFNGTLLADTSACLEADNHVLKTFGGNPITLKIYKDTVSIPAMNFYSVHGCDKNELMKNSGRLGKVFHEFYEKRATKLRSRKNAKSLLKWLHENNIESVILSNHTVAGISYQLERLGMEKLKDFLKSSNLQKEDIIIVGDTCEEIEIGKNMGIKTVAITGGYYSAARLRKGGPDFLISDLGELINIVGKINT